MVTIRFKTPTVPVNQVITFEGRLFCETDDFQSITTEWNNESYEVQHIYSEVHRFEINCKETEFVALQKLKYAYEIYLLSDSVWDRYKLIDLTSEVIAGEFKKVTLKLKKYSGKVISNMILKSDILQSLTIFNSPGHDLTDVAMYLPELKKTEIERNSVDDFDRQINDYSKLRTFYEVRLFLNLTNYELFLSFLNNFRKNYYFKMTNYRTKFYYFSILQNEKIGDDLYMIDLKLTDTTIINTIY